MNILLVLSFLSALYSGQTITYDRSYAHELIYAYEVQYAIPYDELYKTLKCESDLNPKAVNPHDSHGGSFGIAQINASHRDITKEEMLDPIFSIQWAAQQFSEGHQRMWSCYRGSSVD